MKPITVSIKKEGEVIKVLKQDLTDDQLLDKLVSILHLIFSSHSVSKDFKLKFKLETRRREVD